jgi:hypothetical protein
MSRVAVLVWCWLVGIGAGAVRAQPLPTWNEPYLDIATLMVAHDIQVVRPSTYGATVPFVMVARDASYVTYPQKANGACAQTTYALTSAAEYSCATLDLNNLVPLNCQTPTGVGLGALTDADVRAMATSATHSALFTENNTLSRAVQERETSNAVVGGVGVVLTNDTRHYHYVFRATTPLAAYSGECMFARTPTCNASYALANVSLTSPRLSTQPSARRIHAAAIVPYVTFAAADQWTWHFQYHLPQLVRDCAHRGLAAVAINETRGASAGGGGGVAVVGYEYTYTLVYGFVRAKVTDVYDARTYTARVLSHGALGDFFASYSVLLATGATSYAFDADFHDVPRFEYDARDGARARMILAVRLRYTNQLASDRVIYGPGMYGAGAALGNTSYVTLSPSNCVDASVVSVAPAYAGTANRTFCVGGTTCTYVVRIATAYVALPPDGTAFTAACANATRVAQQFDLSVRQVQCTYVGDADVRNCSVRAPATYDFVRLSVRAFVQPRAVVAPLNVTLSACVVWSRTTPASAPIAQPTLAQVLDEACVAYANASAVNAQMCVGRAARVNNATQDTHVTLVPFVTDLAALPTRSPSTGVRTPARVSIDLASLVVVLVTRGTSATQVSASAAGTTSPIVHSTTPNVVLRLDANAAAWPGFLACVTARTRGNAAYATLDLLNVTAGLDALQVSVARLDAFLNATIGASWAALLVARINGTATIATSSSSSSSSAQRVPFDVLFLGPATSRATTIQRSLAMAPIALGKRNAANLMVGVMTFVACALVLSLLLAACAIRRICAMTTPAASPFVKYTIAYELTPQTRQRVLALSRRGRPSTPPVPCPTSTHVASPNKRRRSIVVPTS